MMYTCSHAAVIHHIGGADSLSVHLVFHQLIRCPVKKHLGGKFTVLPYNESVFNHISLLKL